MKIQSCFRHVWVLAFLLGMGPIGALGQAIGVEVVVDTAFYGPNTPTPEDTFDPDGELDGYVSYLVYVNFTNPTDVLSAIFSDVNVYPQGGSMGLDAPCGCWNPDDAFMTMNAGNIPLLWNTVPGYETYEYDTFWTIGMLRGDAPGSLPSFVSDPPLSDGSGICDSQIEDGSAFVTGAPVNAIAGDDLKVVVARVTTCGDWTLNLNLQVFVDGDQANNQIYFLDADGNGAITVEDPCEDYAGEEANLSGLTTACAGLTTDVSMEFLGLSEAEENTTYSLWTSEDNQYKNK